MKLQNVLGPQSLFSNTVVLSVALLVDLRVRMQVLFS